MKAHGNTFERNTKPSNETIEVWYRYEDFLESNGVDEYDNNLGSHIALRLCEFTVIKKTPCGVRLDNGRVVLDSSNKKYACPTKELAMESFIARKKRQISIIENQLRNARKAIELIKRNKRTEYGPSL